MLWGLEPRPLQLSCKQRRLCDLMYEFYSKRLGSNCQLLYRWPSSWFVDLVFVVLIIRGPEDRGNANNKGKQTLSLLRPKNKVLFIWGVQISLERRSLKSGKPELIGTSNINTNLPGNNMSTILWGQIGYEQITKCITLR